MRILAAVMATIGTAGTAIAAPTPQLTRDTAAIHAAGVIGVQARAVGVQTEVATAGSPSAKKATGHNWYDELQQRVIRPLGLHHTRPDRSPMLPHPHARSYQPFERLVDVTEQVLNDQDGSLVSTTADLNTFFRALFDGRLLKPAQLTEVTTNLSDLDPQIAELMPDSQYGLGIFKRPLPCGGEYWGHGGGDGGFITETGVTTDGRRSAVVSMSSVLGREWADALRQQHLADELIGNALCDASS